jgi:DNA replication and repair protein RecF
MILQRLSIVNYKNIREALLDFSPKMNCLIGHNGAGKTNVLDAIYFLSFCRSSQTALDSQVIRHDEPFFMLEGEYVENERDGVDEEAVPLKIYCGMKRGTKKHFKRDKKEYRRMSEHIGLIPLVLVSPSDTLLIEGGSEERRRLMDMVISQLERPYIEALTRYNKALQQRNAMLKMEDAEPDPEVLGILEEQMATEGEYIYDRRKAFVEELTPLFQHLYEHISGGHEQVSLGYTSHCQRGPLLDVIRRDRMKDRAVGYSLHGIHRDDLEILLDGHPMRREGSQGQQKTFVIALKLAQFSFLKRAHNATTHAPTPLLLLDDIFDKLDASRVEQIVSLVSGEEFGQIFITDTNREHLDQILSASSHDYKIFQVKDGEIV